MPRTPKTTKIGGGWSKTTIDPLRTTKNRGQLPRSTKLDCSKICAYMLDPQHQRQQQKKAIGNNYKQRQRDNKLRTTTNNNNNQSTKNNHTYINQQLRLEDCTCKQPSTTIISDTMLKIRIK